MERGLDPNDEDSQICRFADGCRSPMPQLGLEESSVVWIVWLCRWQFDREMTQAGSRRVGLPIERVESVARSVDFPLCEYTIEKINAAVEVIFRYDTEVLERSIER